MAYLKCFHHPKKNSEQRENVLFQKLGHFSAIDLHVFEYFCDICYLRKLDIFYENAVLFCIKCDV